uniref:beta strand repeat-containing protein n=1 Tax=Polaribacter aestuariivivens TaxID=2304626 RepID=UPI003F49219D
MKKNFFKVLEFGEILQTNKKISKGLVFSFTLLLFISFQSFAQNPITSATTILQPATPSTYTEGGQLYEWGQGNNIILDKIVFNGEEFFLDNTFSQTNYSIVRVNGNGGISYERFGIFAQENTGNFNYAPSLPGSFGSYSMEDLLDEPFINRGANDVFKNATSTAQNIERIDVTYVPFKVPNLPNLDKVGFIASEKDGNSSYKAAAITSVDALGNPLTFGPVITIQDGDYGIITGDLDFDILANNSEGGNPIRITDNVQSVGITIITLSDLGIGINDVVYGISFFDDNVADDADLLDVASFPNLNGGGADIFGGLGAIATSIGTVSGNVYLDINGNGTKDSNEPGLKNITVSILGSDGGYQTVVTDSNGNYTGFVPGGNTTITINENDPDLPPNFTRSEGSNPIVISAIEGQDVNIGNIGYTSDNDNDGVIDLNDVDDDNDGILDTEELTIGAITYNPLGDEDGDKIVNYLDTSDDGTGDGSTTNYTTTGIGGIPDVYDFDDDGIPNHLDLDSDNDGIPDNIEAQTTNDYIAPGGAVGSGFTDVDGDGLDDNYDPIVSGGTPGIAITPVNSDSATVTDNPDYLDLDSDEDGVSDTIEANLTLSGNVGENGLDNFYDNGDGYTDVNGSFDNTQTDNFPDDGSNASNGLPDDVNWRDSAVLGQLDRDNDGIPDITDIDDDNDGILDSEEDANLDTDNDPSTSPTDTDGDGVPNYLDLDSDNDGIPDNIEGQSTATYVAPTGGVGANGLYDVYENNDTLGATSYTVENTDGTDNPDYIDLDSDNDDTSDRIEANISLNGSVGLNGLDSNQENADNYADANGSYDNTPFNDFPNTNVADSPDEVDWRDATTQFIDTDNDGVPDATDLDDDNDGILDTDEGFSDGPCTLYNGTIEDETAITNSGNITGTPDGNFGEVYEAASTFDFDFGTVYPAGTQYQITWRKRNTLANGAPPAVMDLSESEDGSTYTADRTPRPENTNSITFETITITSSIDFRYIRLSKGTTSTVDYEVDAIGIIPANCSTDTDNDGIPNYLDLDSDNDGIPDNIEAQTTQGYSAPDGVFDIFGVDTAYTEGLTPVDTDLDGTPDYLETDSDNDGLLDNVEADLTLTGVYGINGLDNAYDNGDNYIDVNGSFDDSQIDNFPDQDADVFNGGDVDYRDAIFDIDVDQDGISNAIDLDDDNDGILDTDEGRRTLLANSGFNNFTAPTFGDNVGLSITPWVLESGTNTNVVKVDGAGGTTYGNGGPEFDATGVAGNYFTINGSDGVLYQTFTLTETTIVDYGGFISARNGNTATGKLSIYSGTGSGGTELSSTGPKVATSSSIWLKIGNSVTLPAGTYSLVADLEEDINFDEAFAFSNIDSDGDGIPNHFDLDSDNDGIPDNIEAQTTAGYIAPSGSYSLSGIDLAYGTGLTPVNTDGTDLPDYLDLDSDNEGGFDIVESGAGLTDANVDGVADGAPSVFGINGLINTLETGDIDLGYTDVNGEYDNTFTSVFTDTDGDVSSGGDLDYRDNIVGVDSDGDGIVNSIDIDDDNDGIPDVNEDSQIISFVTTPEAYWPLDGNTEDAINSNDERANGAAPSYSTDAIQGTNSADFNGTTNTIRYSQDGTFMESSYTEISFSAWIKPDLVTGQRIIYEEGGGTHGATLWIDNGVLTFSTRNTSNQRNITHPTSLTVDGEWHHVAATFSNGILTVYLDGVPASIDVSADYTTIPAHGSDGG